MTRAKINVVSLEYVKHGRTGVGEQSKGTGHGRWDDLIWRLVVVCVFLFLFLVTTTRVGGWKGTWGLRRTVIARSDRYWYFVLPSSSSHGNDPPPRRTPNFSFLTNCSCLNKPILPHLPLPPRQVLLPHYLGIEQDRPDSAHRSCHSKLHARHSLLTEFSSSPTQECFGRGEHNRHVFLKFRRM